MGVEGTWFSKQLLNVVRKHSVMWNFEKYYTSRSQDINLFKLVTLHSVSAPLLRHTSPGFKSDCKSVIKSVLKKLVVELSDDYMLWMV